MDLTIIIPCYNERDNVAPMVARLDAALAGLAWEAVFVDDDSPDGTADAARAVAAHDPRIRCIRRIGRRGLASAVIEGALSSSADHIAVIDGDLQHDETRLPDLLEAVRSGAADIAVGSRHVDGGDSNGLSSAWRHRISQAGIRAAQRLTGVAVADPMSGFFLMRRPAFERLAPRLTAQGFKILLDLLLSAPAPLRVVEIPVRFHARQAGESKLDVLVIVQFGALLIDKMTRGMVPLRFVSFALVGLIGLLIHLLVLQVARSAGLGFETSQIVSTGLAMLANFWLNNTITYRDRKLSGTRLWAGLVVFVLVCSVGAVANVGVARSLYLAHAGWNPAAAAGAAIGGVWNYAVSSTLVWGARI